MQSDSLITNKPTPQLKMNRISLMKIAKSDAEIRCSNNRCSQISLTLLMSSRRLKVRHKQSPNRKFPSPYLTPVCSPRKKVQKLNQLASELLGDQI